MEWGVGVGRRKEEEGKRKIVKVRESLSLKASVDL